MTDRVGVSKARGYTAAELVEVLRQLPPATPIYAWNGDDARFEPVSLVTSPSKEAATLSKLPTGASVLWT